MREYGVMPWHFGGPEVLTYREADALFRFEKKRQDAESKASKKK